MSTESHGLWARLYGKTIMDESIVKAGPLAELIFLRSIAWCALVQSSGSVRAADMHQLGRAVRASGRHVDALVQHSLWLPHPSGSGWTLKGWEKYQPRSTSDKPLEQVRAYERDKKRRQRGSDVPEMSPGHVPAVPVPRKEENRKEGSDRTPSGSVRSEPARAAPRGAGGAARHAPAAEVESGEPFDGDPREHIRELLSTKPKAQMRPRQPISYPYSQQTAENDNGDDNSNAIPDDNPLAQIISGAFGIPKEQ